MSAEHQLLQLPRPFSFFDLAKDKVKHWAVFLPIITETHSSYCVGTFPARPLQADTATASAVPARRLLRPTSHSQLTVLSMELCTCNKISCFSTLLQIEGGISIYRTRRRNFIRGYRVAVPPKLVNFPPNISWY
jgi:hypothetical protein